MQENAVTSPVASDRRGFRAILLLLAASLLLIPPTASAARSARYALLIVNTDYSRPLDQHREDGQALKEPLSSLGFRVTRYSNLNLKAMRAAIRYFSNKLEERPSSIGFVYFVGYHSRHLNQTYLLPARAELDSEGSTAGLNLAWIIDELKFADNRSTAVFINAYDLPDADHSIPLGGNDIASTLAALVETDSSLSLGFSHPPDSPVPADSDAQLRYRDWLVGMLSTPDSSLLGLLNDPGGSAPGTARAGQFSPWSVSGPDAREHWARTPVKRAAKPRPAAAPKRNTSASDKPLTASTTRSETATAAPAPAKPTDTMVAQANPQPPAPVPAPKPTPTPVPVAAPRTQPDPAPKPTPAATPKPQVSDIEPVDSVTRPGDIVPEASMEEGATETEQAAPAPTPEPEAAEAGTSEQTAKPADEPDSPASAETSDSTVAADTAESNDDATSPDPHIAEYMEKAQQAFKQQRLTTPKDDSAYFWAKKVLEIEPNNAAAHKLLNQAFGRYLAWANTQYQREDMRKAKRHTRRARTLSAYASRRQLRRLASLEHNINNWQPPPPPVQAPPPVEEPKGVLDTLKEWFGAEPEQQSAPDTEHSGSSPDNS